ncbi:MAG: rod shape-determining protein MreD [Solirubrobacterales bacterium]
MIVTPRIGLRIALIVLAGVVLQVSFFSYLSLLGATPDALAVVIVCLGLLGGGVIGAVCGFAAGIVLDSVLLQTLGVSSLVLLGAGYLAGRYREGFEISSPLVAPLLAGALTAFAALGFGAIQLMLGVETQVSLLVVREVVVKGLLAFLFALAIYPLLRRILRPALVDVPVPARRRLLSRARVRRRERGRRGQARLSGVAARRVRGGLT